MALVIRSNAPIPSVGPPGGSTGFLPSSVVIGSVAAGGGAA
jgi:hypothetical protein